MVPWSEFTPGDVFKFKDPVTKVLKLYFIGVQSTEPYAVDMGTLYVYDAATRLLARPAVTRVGDDIDEPLMRIRCVHVSCVFVWGGRWMGGRQSRGESTGGREATAVDSTARQRDQRRTATDHFSSFIKSKLTSNIQSKQTRKHANNNNHRPDGITVEDAKRAPPPWAVLAEDYWHDPVPAPDELGYDASKHSPEALRAAFEALTNMRRAPAAAAAAAAAVAAAEGGVGVEQDLSDGAAADEAGPEEEPYYDMPDVPAVDMM